MLKYLQICLSLQFIYTAIITHYCNDASSPQMSMMMGSFIKFLKLNIFRWDSANFSIIITSCLQKRFQRNVSILSSHRNQQEGETLYRTFQVLEKLRLSQNLSTWQLCHHQVSIWKRTKCVKVPETILDSVEDRINNSVSSTLSTAGSRYATCFYNVPECNIACEAKCVCVCVTKTVNVSTHEATNYFYIEMFLK